MELYLFKRAIDVEGNVGKSLHEIKPSNIKTDLFTGGLLLRSGENSVMLSAPSNTLRALSFLIHSVILFFIMEANILYEISATEIGLHELISLTSASFPAFIIKVVQTVYH